MVGVKDVDPTRDWLWRIGNCQSGGEGEGGVRGGGINNLTHLCMDGDLDGNLLQTL